MNLNSSEAVWPRSKRSLSLLLLLVGALLGSVVVLVTPGSPAGAQSAPAAGVYVPLSPARILDTRNPGTGGPIAAQTSRDIQVTGLGGVPTTDVLAVAVTVAAFNNTSDGWGLMWQAGTTRPNPASNINYIPGRVVNNAITSKVSAAGKVSYYTLASTDITVDVVGYYRSSPGGGGYVAVPQTRILNTSTTAGAKVAAGTTFDRKLRGVAGIPDSTAVTAVALNMSTFNQEAHGLSIVYPRGQARPDTSTMNYVPWRIQTQLVLAKLSADGFSNFYVSTTTDVILDIVGYYTEGSGARFVPLPANRVIDTRYNIPGWGKGPITQPLAPGTDTAIKLTGMAGVPETGVSAVLVNAIADTVGSATGFLTFWATGDARPDTNNLTYYANEDSANLVIAKVGADGKAIVTNSYGSTALALDIVGYFSTDPGPSAPTNVMAAPADQGAAVAWGPPVSDGGRAVDGYLVKVYKTTPTLSYVKETTTCASCTSTTISGLTNGQGYRFDVFARNSFGYGSSATTNGVTAGGSSDLLRPIITQVSSGNGQATVAWTRPSVRVEGLTTYVVRVFAEASPTTVAGSTTVTDPTSTAVVAGLINGQSYFATVTASTLLVINVESARSAPFVTAGAPLAPPRVEAFPSDGKALVTWPVTESNGATISRYEIAVIDFLTQAQVSLTPASGSGTEVLGLTNGTQYQFKVRATNAVGTGPYSTVSEPVTPAGRPFRLPPITVAPGNGQVTVTWEAPARQADGTPGDNGATLTSYEITMAPGGQSQTTGAQITSTTFSGLENGTEYVFMVAARNASGSSDPSYGTAVPAAPPVTPLNVVASSRDTSAYLHWDRSSPVGVAVTYTVVASPGGRSISTQSTSAVVDGLTNGEAYTFTVRATNTAGTSAFSLPSNSVAPQAIGVLPPPGPSCRTSTLPAPPAEVRVGDSIQRRIDVPCMPEYGRVRMGFFIVDSEVELFPNAVVIGRGDGRSFDPNMTPMQNRFYIEIDYATGTGYVQVNKSCRSLDDSTCTRAQSLVNHFSSLQLAADGTIILHFSIGDAAVGETPFLGRVEVSGHLEIIPMNGNQVCFTGSASRYPSIEVYHDRSDSTTRTLAQVPQSQWGPIAMLGSDHGISGC